MLQPNFALQFAVQLYGKSDDDNDTMCNVNNGIFRDKGRWNEYHVLSYLHLQGMYLESIKGLMRIREQEVWVEPRLHRIVSSAKKEVLKED